MREEIRQEIALRLAFLQENRDRLIVDADVHLTDLEHMDSWLQAQLRSKTNYYHGRPIGTEDLLREMKMASVDLCLAWQNPAATLYSNSQERNFRTLLAANRFLRESALQHPYKIIPGGWTDPLALGEKAAIQMVDLCVLEYGFAFIKMHPAQNSYPLDSISVFRIMERIIELGAVPVFHFGSDTSYTPPSGLRKLAKNFPDHPIVGVHMGGGGAGFVEAEEQYAKSRRLGLEYNNLFFIQSAKRESHMESDFITYQMAGDPYCHHLACGSDAPYGRMTWNFGGFRAMFASLLDGENHTDIRVRSNPDLFNENAIQNYLGRNMVDLMIWGCQSILTSKAEYPACPKQMDLATIL